MPIILTKGDIFKSGAQALVNPVNTVGVMGAGLALQFKVHFPEMFAIYRNACRLGQVRIGEVSPIIVAGSKYVLNFPTKKSFLDPSKLEYIITGLKDLVVIVEDLKIKSIAIPALGSGLGQLQWKDVKPLIVQAAEKMEGVEVFIYEPR